MVDFSKINDEHVGSLLVGAPMVGSCSRRSVDFKTIMDVHLGDAVTYEEAHENLSQDYKSILQDISFGDEFNLAKLLGYSLDALAIRKSMDLIEENYLK